MKRKQADMTGQRFARLVVIEDLGFLDDGVHWCRCRCDCGNVTDVRATDLRRETGNVKSCGCLRREKSAQTARTYFHKRDEMGTNLGNISCDLPYANNHSGCRGVTRDKRTGGYRAYIGVRGKQIILGSFSTLQAAERARKAAEEKYYKPILEKAGIK